MKRQYLLLVAATVMLVSASCTAPSGAGGDQVRFNEQQNRYPDRLRSEQEAEHAERARLDDRLKKP